MSAADSVNGGDCGSQESMFNISDSPVRYTPKTLSSSSHKDYESFFDEYVVDYDIISDEDSDSPHYRDTNDKTRRSCATI